MIVVVAGNHDEYEAWLSKNFTYVGDRFALDKIDPVQVEKIQFVGNFRDHPFYWSDDLLRFQMDVALAARDLHITNMTRNSGEASILTRLKNRIRGNR